jgi:hypothetical protein
MTQFPQLYGLIIKARPELIEAEVADYISRSDIAAA